VTQTKQHIKNLLHSAQTRPRHRWGQNFLIDLNLMRLMVNRAELNKNDVVLEVGCGTGSLTSLLAASAARVIVAEIDPVLLEIATRELADVSNVTFIDGDVLQNKSTIAPAVTTAIKQACLKQKGRFKLIANLPYQIASPLILNLLQGESLPDTICVTIQAEVANRMLAKVNSGQYGHLSIMMQATGQVELLRRLPPQAFWPMPQVHSAMIAWQQDLQKLKKIKSIVALSNTIDLLMGHRRKKIRTCLKQASLNFNSQELLSNLNIDPDLRGESLTPDQYVQLANAL
jgi:16S rRNA (adenine1518-N6/adenine1519-N6)-dimethyltransferase